VSAIAASDCAGFEGANDIFHRVYGGSRSQIGEQTPLLILLATELILHRGGTRTSVVIAPALFHRIKAAAHTAVSLYVLLRELPSGVIGEKTLLELEFIKAAVAAALGELEQSQTENTLQELLQTCAELASSAAEARSCSPERLARFARKTGPAIACLLDIATRAQLETLHAKTEELLAELDADEHASLQVVVAGDHQARKRSLAMQYFQKRLGETEDRELRVSYGENVQTEEQARTLIGTKRLDEAIALAFFDDQRRLQRDVLGDAAARCLATFDFRAR
jgi:hypothetical protein